MSLEDIVECIRVTKTSEWFIDRFEITIEDMLDRFEDRVQEEEEQLPFDLEMDSQPEEYEDRGEYYQD